MVDLIDDVTPPEGIVRLASNFWGNSVWDVRWTFINIPKGFYNGAYYYICRNCVSSHKAAIYVADPSHLRDLYGYKVCMSRFRLYVEDTDSEVMMYMGRCNDCKTMYWGSD